MGNLKKPKPVDKKVKSRGLPPKAKATTKLEKKLKDRKKYLSEIEGN